MRYLLVFFISFCFGQVVFAQDIEREEYDQMLTELLKSDVPEINVKEAYTLSKEEHVVFIDTREKEEYDVSHIEGAIWVGYNDFSLKRLKDIDKDTKIIAYCSVGLRSENITRKLIKKGFTNVQNLYGSIFEWMNQDLPVVDENEQPTQEIHAYDEHWGQWVDEGEKVYE